MWLHLLYVVLSITQPTICFNWYFKNILLNKYELQGGLKLNKKYIERPKKFDQRAYNSEYSKTHYRKLSTDIKPEDYNLIDTYCKTNGISKAKFIVEACKYYIDNHWIIQEEKNCNIILTDRKIIRKLAEEKAKPSSGKYSHINLINN